MPWSTENTLPSLKNKSKETRELFAKVANEALSKGRTEDEAITAGLAAVANLQRKTQKAFTPYKPPSHLTALLAPKKEQEAKPEEPKVDPLKESLKKALLPKGSLPSNVERNLIKVEVDPSGRLVFYFDTGEKIVTEEIKKTINLDQYVSVTTGSPTIDSQGSEQPPVVLLTEESFIVKANKQVLVKEEITLEQGAEIVVEEGAILSFETAYPSIGQAPLSLKQDQVYTVYENKQVVTSEDITLEQGAEIRMEDNSILSLIKAEVTDNVKYVIFNKPLQGFHSVIMLSEAGIAEVGSVTVVSNNLVTNPEVRIYSDRIEVSSSTDLSGSVLKITGTGT